MSITIKFNGSGFEVEIRVNWKSLAAFLRGALATALVLMALLSSPVVVRFLTWLGW